MTIFLVWFVSVRDACVVLNFPFGDVVSLHLFNARGGALCVRSPHTSFWRCEGSTCVHYFLCVFRALGSALFSHVMLNSTHGRKRLTFDARHSEAVRQNLGTRVRRFLILPLSFPFGEWHPVRVFACWVFSGCVDK